MLLRALMSYKIQYTGNYNIDLHVSVHIIIMGERYNNIIYNSWGRPGMFCTHQYTS